MEHKDSKNNLFLLTIVGIVAIVAIVIMIASTTSRSYTLSEDVAGAAARASASADFATEGTPVTDTTTTATIAKTICADSDGGKNYDVKGTTKAGKTSRTDFCRNYNSSTLVEYYCSYNKVISKNYNCQYGCENGACIQGTREYGLKDYPEPFILNNGYNVKLILGSKSPATDTLAAMDIGASLQRLINNYSDNVTPIAVGIAKLDTDLDFNTAYTQNYISIGSSCVNTYTAFLFGNPADCNTKNTMGIGTIELLRPGNKNAYTIVVSGYSADDDLKAARVLANWHDYPIFESDTNKICVSGDASTGFKAYDCQQAGGYCGDGIIQAGEMCDGKDLGYTVTTTLPIDYGKSVSVYFSGKYYQISALGYNIDMQAVILRVNKDTKTISLNKNVIISGLTLSLSAFNSQTATIILKDKPASCSAIGNYTNGTLSCDLKCTFDTRNCTTGTISRRFSSNSVPPNTTVAVTLAKNFAYQQGLLLIEEQVPSSFVILSNGGGSVSGNIIRWALFNNISSGNYTYTVRTSANPGTYSFSGVYSVNGGATQNVIGSTQVTVLNQTTGNWTVWFNRDDGSGSGDYEQKTYFPTVCSKPLSVECVTVSGEIPSSKTGQVTHCSASGGFYCLNSENINTCLDYKVRWLCP
jgi:hypothetical protein